MDKVEEQIAKIIVPLQEANAIVEETLKLPNLPEYMGQTLRGMSSDIESIIGYTSSYDKSFHPGKIVGDIRRVRDDLPKGAIKAETEKLRQGVKQSML
jgi:hypothetical protein